MATLATSGAAVFKAGKNVSTTITEAQHNYALLQAEAVINAMTRYNWIDKYASLNVDVKYILEEICSNLAAIYLISFDMSGYTTRIEAEDMINILRDASLRGLSILRDKKAQDFINGA